MFRITVTNTGAEGLKDVEVTDPRAPSCDRSVVQTVELIRNIGNRDDIFDV